VGAGRVRAAVRHLTSPADRVLADKAYSARANRAYLRRRHIPATIPTRPTNRPIGGRRDRPVAARRRSTQTSTSSGMPSSAASTCTSSTAASPLATTSSPFATTPPCRSPTSTSGCATYQTGPDTATAVVTLPACDLRERKASRGAERNRRRFELRIPAELRTTAVAVLIGSWLRSPRGWRWWTGHGRPPGHPPGEEHPGSCGNLGEQVGLRVAHVELVAQTRDGRAQQVAVPTPAQARH
jgi:hypothetical protein